MSLVSLSDESGSPADKKYSLRFVILTDVLCFISGYMIHYMVEHHE
jgi:hypothetical protein